MHSRQRIWTINLLHCCCSRLSGIFKPADGMRPEVAYVRIDDKELEPQTKAKLFYIIQPNN
eukprot:scaffold631949_cov19-Prasinocladus_malaysianus.AAC.1